MTTRDINVCPSTLAEGYSTYSKTALRNLFDGSKVSHHLGFTWEDDEDAKAIAENARKLSISGDCIVELWQNEPHGLYGKINNPSH